MLFGVDYIQCNYILTFSIDNYCHYFGLERDDNFKHKTSNPRVMIDIVFDTNGNKKRRAIAWVLHDLPPFVRILALSSYYKIDEYEPDLLDTNTSV